MLARIGLLRGYVQVGARIRPRNRNSCRTSPLIELLEGRSLLAVAMNGGQPSATVDMTTTLGVAWQEVLNSQTETHQALGRSYRQVEAESTQFAAICAGALNSASSGGAVYAKDLKILERGQSDATGVLQALLVARRVEDQGIAGYQADLQNGLYTSPKEIVNEATNAGTTFARQGNARARELARELDYLAEQLPRSGSA